MCSEFASFACRVCIVRDESEHVILRGKVARDVGGQDRRSTDSKAHWEPLLLASVRVLGVLLGQR